MVLPKRDNIRAVEDTLDDRMLDPTKGVRSFRIVDLAGVLNENLQEACRLKRYTLCSSLREIIALLGSLPSHCG